MMENNELFVIGIITCRRPEYLAATLEGISSQVGIDNINIRIVIVDNDEQASAANTVNTVKKQFRFPIDYSIEKNKGIPFARNHVVRVALKLNAQALIFIDDDEIPKHEWISQLISYYLVNRGNVHVVGGPVRPIFTGILPNWLPESLFSKKAHLNTGARMSCASTSNVLIELDIIRKNQFRFQEKMQYCGSTDTDFFWRVSDAGYKIHWCAEAIVEEIIPQYKLRFLWICQRYFRYGASNTYSLRLRYGYRKATFLRLRRAFGLVFFRIVKEFIQLRKEKKINKKNLVTLFTYLLEAFGILYGLLGFKWNEYKKTFKKPSTT